jgi:hypothetical protein
LKEFCAWTTLQWEFLLGWFYPTAETLKRLLHLTATSKQLRASVWICTRRKKCINVFLFQTTRCNTSQSVQKVVQLFHLSTRL